MANWTAKPSATAPRIKVGDQQFEEEAKNPRLEPPNIAFYVDYSDLDDPTRIFTPFVNASAKQVRIASNSFTAILKFIANQIALFNSIDAGRMVDLQAEFEAISLPGDGTLALPALPDPAKLQALQDAQVAFQAKFQAVLAAKNLADAIAADPTVADAKAAVDDAQAAIAADVKIDPAQPAKPIGP